MTLEQLKIDLEKSDIDLAAVLQMRSQGAFEMFREFCEEEDCYVSNGCSRLVLIPKDGDFVMKFPFGERKGLCEREEALYLEAEARGCEIHLARTAFGGEVKGVRFWVQEKLETDYDSESEVEARCSDEIRSWLDPDSFEDEDEYEEAVADEIQGLSTEAVVVAVCGDWQLASFLENRGINDLHSGNWGWRGSELVCFDFAGF